MKGGIVAVLLVGPATDRDAFSAADTELVDSAGALIALMLENARLSERAVEQDRILRDVALAAEVQRRLLPEQLPDVGARSLAAFTRPARTVGGDYYDVIELSGGKVVIAVGDIAGKGIAAALLMAVLQGSLRATLAEGPISCAALAKRLNRILHQSTASNGYATLFYAEIDPRTRQLEYVNAGHTTPFLVRGTNDSVECVPLDTGGTVLGLFADAEFEDASLPLQTGDLLAAFTDGVTEARNALDQEYGEAQLKALLQRTMGLRSSDVASVVREQLHGWTRDAEAFDDCTFVAAKMEHV
jgi:sigma-B regulation protein RsbU (phosphoserine phosphatase)